MSEMAFGIAAYAACGLPQAGAADVRWPARYDAGGGGSTPPVLLRRRVTPVGQAALRSAWALPRLDEARFVFASRHGEFDRTFTMLTQLASQEPPSPADFSLGVHNALAGLLSVATRNRRGHTALAAGIDSFGFGLMEAAACVHEAPDEPVALVYFDAPLPEPYRDIAPADVPAPRALAVLLRPSAEAPRRVTMTMRPAGDAEPQDAAAVFLTFLQGTAPEASATGEAMRWTWHNA